MLNELFKTESKNNPNNLESHIFDLNRSQEIHNLYQSYDGKAEFLYIPSLNEIQDVIKLHKGCYYGMQDKAGNIVSVMKLEKLQLPSPFFVPPAYEKEDGQFLGLSGLLVAKNYRKQGIARTMITNALNSLVQGNYKGIYADCDYRNVASFSTLSSFLNFAGYADGRNGAEGEKTIYTTFYLSFNKKDQMVIPNLNLDFTKCKDLEEVNHLLQRKMATLGSFSTHKVNYADGYNLLHVFDEAIRQDTITLSLQDEKPVTIAKKPLNISNNKTQGRQYE
ncbi:MAG: GNAT family N-acetyltransferase [Alphaproteobacteria bacterium]|nr:GNAT family N-acetyltransferase [Alphaproteobacteria bacterium]